MTLKSVGFTQLMLDPDPDVNIYDVSLFTCSEKLFVRQWSFPPK